MSGISARGRRRFTPPRYPPKVWTQYQSVLEDLTRTNNYSEGWHTRFMTLLAQHHPSFYKFLTQILKEQQEVECMLRQLNLGQRIKAAPTQKRITKERNVKNIVANYAEKKLQIKLCNICQIWGISSNFKLIFVDINY